VGRPCSARRGLTGWRTTECRRQRSIGAVNAEEEERPGNLDACPRDEAVQGTRVNPSFRPQAGTRRVGDARLTSLPGEPFLLFLGDVTPDKGARHLTEVYATLDRPPPLVMIGRCFIDELAPDLNIDAPPANGSQPAGRRPSG